MAPKNIDQAGKKALYVLLSKAKTRELIYVESTLHTAYLAAFQVYGKRIQFLEERKDDVKQDDFSLEDILLDVLLDLVLNGAAGKLIEAGAKGLFRPLIRSRQAYYAIPKVKMPKKKIKIVGVTLSAAQLKEARKKVQTKLQKHFNRVANSDDFYAFNVIAKEILDSSLERASDEARSAVNVPKSGGAPKAGSKGSSKTPVVEILAAALAGYNVQRNAVERMYADLEAELLYSEILVDTATEWQNFLKENAAVNLSSSALLTKFNERMFLWYEMSMWAYIFDVEALTKTKSGGTVYGPDVTKNQERAKQRRLVDPRNFKIHKENQNAVIYQRPDLYPVRAGYGTGYEVVNKKLTVKISKLLLDYWINSFPYKFDNYPGPTVFEHYDKRFGFSEGIKNKEDRTRIMAYEDVLSDLRYVRSRMKEGKRNLVAAGLGSGR